jgi:drug/metabolite transporter (DMT)-like permease
VTGVALTGHAARDWAVFVALAAGPMVVGHTGINYALRYVPAYVANLAILGEPVGATLIAWLLPAIREVPGPQVAVGVVLVLIGIAIGGSASAAVRRRGASRPREGASVHGRGRRDAVD